MIADGTYRARAKDWQLGYTSGGKEQVAVQFVLLDADGVEGPSLTWYGYFTDATQSRTLESLRHCGWTGSDLADLQGLDRNEVSLVVESETYQGKTTAKVRWVNAPGGAGVSVKAPMDDAQKRAFAARMRGVVAAHDVASGTKQPEQRQFSADEDIPF